MTLIPPIFLRLKMSAFYVCCIFPSALDTKFYHEANTMNTEDTSDLGPYCLQYWLPKNLSRGESRRQRSWLAGKELKSGKPGGS